MVSDTNIIAKNSVNVCEERQSFEGGLQKLINTTFWNWKLWKMSSWYSKDESQNYLQIKCGNHFKNNNSSKWWREENSNPKQCLVENQSKAASWNIKFGHSDSAPNEFKNEKPNGSKQWSKENGEQKINHDQPIDVLSNPSFPAFL